MPSTKQARSKVKFPPASKEAVARFEHVMHDWPMVDRRKMFGYPTAFFNGQMFIGLFGNNMFLRLSADDRAKFVDKFKAKALEPMPGRPMKEYVIVPGQMLKQPTELNTWIAQAMAYVRSVPPKKGKRR